MTPCGRCASPLEDGDLRCAVCAMVLTAPPDATAVARATVHRCTHCAAAVSFSAEKQAPHCAFCGSVMEIEQPVDPIERAELRLPFTVEREHARRALKAWLGKRGWFAPKDLVSAASVQKLEPIHWAAWVIEADARVTWAADSDAGAMRSRWAPHAGERAMSFDGILVPASRGLRPDECRQLTPRYDLSTGGPVGPEPAGGDDGAIESFDTQRSAARRTVMAAIEATAVTRLQRETIPGSRFRNVKVSLLIEGLRTRRVALPAWVLAYRYRGSPYRAVIHGQSLDCVVGESPIDWTKVVLLGLAAAAVIAAIVFFLAR